jgi:hypothetical protein
MEGVNEPPRPRGIKEAFAMYGSAGSKKRWQDCVSLSALYFSSVFFFFFFFDHPQKTRRPALDSRAVLHRNHSSFPEMLLLTPDTTTTPLLPQAEEQAHP